MMGWFFIALILAGLLVGYVLFRRRYRPPLDSSLACARVQECHQKGASRGLGKFRRQEESMISWREFETAAPSIAEIGRQRLELARIALLGTLRKDGSPRISPVEPYLSQEHLFFGAMSWSLKTRDLQHDPRCVLHSAITAPDAAEASSSSTDVRWRHQTRSAKAHRAGGKHNRRAPLPSSC